jgi:hypothetical protein
MMPEATMPTMRRNNQQPTLQIDDDDLDRESIKSEVSIQEI